MIRSRKSLTRIRGGFRKAVDEETKSQRMKTDLISNVSHDLKTPLTAITTYVELLKKRISRRRSGRTISIPWSARHSG